MGEAPVARPLVLSAEKLPGALLLRPAALAFPPGTCASASLARVRLTMTDSDPSGRHSRYMPGHLASGTMPSGRGFDSRLMGLVSVTECPSAAGELG
jgi:hypothetical protein